MISPDGANTSPATSATVGPESDPNPVNRAIGSILKKQIASAEKSRLRFMKSGYEIMRYGFSPEYAFEYQTTSANAWFKAKYGKTAEAMQVIVPSLVQTTPYRLLNPRPSANQFAGPRTAVMQDYLNYTTSITGHAHLSRRATEEAVGYGRGVRWTGVDPKTKTVFSTWDTVRNLLVDPNARIWQDVKWVGRIRDLPKWEACTLYPKAKKVIMKLPQATARKSDEFVSYAWEKNDTGTDNVRVYEFYLQCGIHNFKGGIEVIKLLNEAKAKMSDDEAEAMAYTADETPLKFVIAESGRLLDMGPWEIPFHEMPFDGWPCSVLDFYNNPDSIWPVSPLEPGIGFQRAMNHVVTLMMGKFRYTSKTLLAMKKQGRAGLSAKDKDKATPRLSNQDVDIIEVEMQGASENNMSLKNFLESFQWDQTWIAAGVQWLETLERRYERLTGLTEFLAVGQSNTQERSAAAAQIKDRNSRNRIEDMRDREAEHESLLARKEAFAARYLLNKADIGAALGADAAQVWGFLAPPEAQSMDYWITDALNRGITDPQQQVMYAQQQVAGAVDITSFAREIDYSIESASIRRKDIDLRLDTIKDQKNQIVPLQLGSHDPRQMALAYMLIAEEGKLTGMSDAIVKATQAAADFYMNLALNPPPPPGMPPGPPPGAPAGAPPPGPQRQGAHP